MASGWARPTSVSVSSDRRSTVGRGPSWASRRSAVAPSWKERNRQPSYTRVSGRGRIRTVTEVMTPKAPSEPRISWRRSGPAAERGARPVSMVPSGVARVRPSTISSKRPYPADACPLERAAAKPPMVAHSKDCGKWPRVKPCPASRASASGARRPGWRTAVRETGSRSSRPFMRRRSRATNALRCGASPPTTEVPPPKGTTARPCAAQARSTASTWSWPAGRTTACGTSARSPARMRSRSGVDLPRVCRTRLSGSVRTCSSPPTAAASAFRAAGSAVGAGRRMSSRPSAGVLRGLTPSRSRSSPVTESGSGAALAGSPQPFHSMSIERSSSQVGVLVGVLGPCGSAPPAGPGRFRPGPGALHCDT